MSISAATIATYAPWGNATLAFTVSAPGLAVDPETGNPVTLTETLEYLAALEIQQPNWKEQEGADMSTYRVSGRLLSPAVLDPRITNGSQAAAVINGYEGRLEVTYDLQQEPSVLGTTRQNLQGTFRVIGGAPIPPPAPTPTPSPAPTPTP